MSAHLMGKKLAAYSSVATHAGVDSGDPHRMILMLMDGVLERLAMARGCLQRGDIGQKAALIQRVLAIVEELRASLDLQRGGPLAANLSELYLYMERQLLRANSENKSGLLEEVSSLMTEIRSAWAAVPLTLKSQSAAVR
jgi:flagellar protein FliS